MQLTINGDSQCQCLRCHVFEVIAIAKDAPVKKKAYRMADLARELGISKAAVTKMKRRGLIAFRANRIINKKRTFARILLKSRVGHALYRESSAARAITEKGLSPLVSMYIELIDIKRTSNAIAAALGELRDERKNFNHG